jgi:transcriptional/translational regulatory protein YebC/TACO1
MVTSIGGSLISYLNAQDGTDPGAGAGTNITDMLSRANKKSGSDSSISSAAIEKAAGSFKMAGQVKALDASQTALAGDLRAAMNKAGVKLAGSVDFSLATNGTVQIKGSDADQAAVKSFLKADTSQPSFVSRIAAQAKQAMSLSSTIQQSAAISQAAKFGSGSGDVMSLYTSLMQTTNTTTTVFSLSATGSSLTYPGSLKAQA